MKRTFQEFDINMDESINKKVVLVERNLCPNGIQLVNSKAVAKKGSNDLVELAAEIQKANEFVNASACSKLEIIAEQVRFLHEQAQKVLLEAKMNTDLHKVACNFKKIPGNTYYLYTRPSGQQYFSMLSPKEWTNPPHKFDGGFRLEADCSWTPENEISKKDNENFVLNKILASKDDKLSIKFAIESPMDI